MTPLEDSGFEEDAAGGEASKTEGAGIHDAGAAVQNQVGEDAAGSGGVLHAVAGETVGEEKSRAAFHNTENRVVVGRPAAGIYFHVFKAGEAPLEPPPRMCWSRQSTPTQCQAGLFLNTLALSVHAYGS